MDVRLQSKLLRAIQERVIDRVGGARPVPVDIRIIATSNRNLTDAVREGHFREDLLFRLNVVNLKIPALRERPADIDELAQYFIKKYSAANGLTARPLSGEARRALATTAGRAMCASWRTHCIAPCCSRPAPKSASTASSRRMAVGSTKRAEPMLLLRLRWRPNR